MKRIPSILFALVLVVSLALVTAMPVLAQPIYRLKISSTADGSVISPGEGYFYYAQGTVVLIHACPADSGAQFVNWTGDVGTIADVNSYKTTITMYGNYSITANFVRLYYDLTTSSTAGGFVSMPGEGTFTYNVGTVVNLKASIDFGYDFVNWTGDVGTVADVNDPTTTITMNGHYSITANFEEIPEYDLTISSTTGGSVTTPGEGAFTYDEGAMAILVAIPDAGYQFVNWTGDVGTIDNVYAASTFITMNGHYSITANFEAIPPVQHSLTISSTAGGSVTNPVVEGTFTYDEGTVVNLVAIPDADYHFVNWTGDVSTIADVNAATTIITMNGDYSITANFEAIPAGQYSLTISSTTGGSVTTPGEGSFTYDEGTAVDLVASPGVGCYFVNWTGDVDTIADVNAANTTITMQGDYEITAQFLAGVVDAKTETVTDGTVDATEEADTEVAVDGTATVTVARYEDNPGGPAPTGFSSLDKYIDVYVPDTTEANELEIRLYYTDDELTAANISEESLRLFWWDGDDWVACSDSGVNTASTNGYSGYIWAKIRNDTTPALDQLQGTEWGGYGHPSEPPQPCGCFIATAAYGTDTTKEIDVLREFRETVLLPNSLGTWFVSFYYKISPPIANFISQHQVLRTAVRVGFVDPIVKILIWSHSSWSVRGSQ